MKSIFLLGFGVILAASGCKKCHDNDTTPGTTKLKYAQTQCADAWGTSESDAGTIRLVKQYLDRAGLPVTDIYMKAENSAEVCLACTCRTGKIIYVLTASNDTGRFTSLGFNVVK